MPGRRTASRRRGRRRKSRAAAAVSPDGHLVGVVDEGEAMRRRAAGRAAARPRAARATAASTASRAVMRAARGDEFAVARVELREDFRKVDLAPVLPLQFCRRDGERIVIRVLDRHAAAPGRRSSAAWRRTRCAPASERARNSCGSTRASRSLRIRRNADIEKAARRAQSGNFGIELRGDELFPFQREERRARVGEKRFGFDVVDQRHAARRRRRERSRRTCRSDAFVRNHSGRRCGLERTRARRRARASASLLPVPGAPTIATQTSKGASTARRCSRRAALGAITARSVPARRGGLCAHAVAYAQYVQAAGSSATAKLRNAS